jgi:hypothetical protein
MKRLVDDDDVVVIVIIVIVVVIIIIVVVVIIMLFCLQFFVGRIYLPLCDNYEFLGIFYVHLHVRM